MEYLIYFTYATMLVQGFSVFLFFYIASKLRKQWASGLFCFGVSAMVVFGRQFIIAYGVPAGVAYKVSQAIFPLVDSLLTVAGSLLLWKSAKSFEKRSSGSCGDAVEEIDEIIKDHLEELAAANRKLSKLIGKSDADRI